MRKFTHFLLLLLVFSVSLSAQEVNPESTPDEAVGDKKKALRAKAVEMLRATSRELSYLRTTENRISFASDLANLMWLHDDAEAKRMFRRVTDDFVQLLGEYNSRVVALGGMKDEPDLFGGMFNPDPDERQKAVRQMTKAMSVRQKIAISMGEYDGQSAYDFTLRTSDLVTDAKLRKMFSDQNERIEKEILKSFRSSDTAQLLKFGRSSLKRGFKKELIQLARKVSIKDKEDGSEFAGELVSKVISESKPEDKEISNLYAVLSANESSLKKGGMLFSEDERKEVAKELADNLLRAPKDFESYLLDEFVEAIKEFYPNRAKQVEARFAQDKKKDSELDKIVRDAKEAADRAVKEAEKAATDASSGDRITSEKSPMSKLMELQLASESFDGKKLTKGEKAKFVNESREIISTISQPTAKITALSALALRVNKLGDEELAREIMNEAAPFVNQQPKHFMDYLTLWTFIQGSSAVDSDTAFESLEGAIFRLSDTIGAFIKAAEFIDVQGDLVIDGEVQVGTFGGGLVRGVVGQLQAATPVMRNLAEADFDRTRELADKFQQPEIRILAKMIILRSVLDESSGADETALLQRGLFF